MTPAPVARHGRLTRWLHWSMALLFAWVFASALAHALAEKSALDALLWPSHKPVGTLLMLLLVPRVVWALAQARRRQADAADFVHEAAEHAALAAARGDDPAGGALFDALDAAPRLDGRRADLPIDGD